MKKNHYSYEDYYKIGSHLGVQAIANEYLNELKNLFPDKDLSKNPDPIPEKDDDRIILLAL